MIPKYTKTQRRRARKSVYRPFIKIAVRIFLGDTETQFHRLQRAQADALIGAVESVWRDANGWERKIIKEVYGITTCSFADAASEAARTNELPEFRVWNVADNFLCAVLQKNKR